MISVLVDNWDLFMTGFLTTIELFLIAGALSLVFGTLLAACRVSSIPQLRAVGTGYVNTVRSTPLTLVFAFLVFAAPKMGLQLPSFFWSAITALTLYTGAFVCEVLRAGINTVPAGQAEAARTIGLSYPQVLGLVVLPQAFRSIVPPLMSLAIALLKNTTIAAGFSVAEAGSIPAAMAERGENQMFTLLWISVGFLLMIIPIALLQRWAERRVALAA
jgi:glutamate transport system permease protein